MINKKNINNAEGDISIIKSQFSNEVYERLKIVRNITFLQENNYFIIKQNKKINESITKTATDIKTEIQIITNKVNNLTTEFNKRIILESTVQSHESKIDNIKKNINITNINTISIRLN